MDVETRFKIAIAGLITAGKLAGEGGYSATVAGKKACEATDEIFKYFLKEEPQEK